MLAALRVFSWIVFCARNTTIRETTRSASPAQSPPAWPQKRKASSKLGFGPVMARIMPPPALLVKPYFRWLSRVLPKVRLYLTEYGAALFASLPPIAIVRWGL